MCTDGINHRQLQIALEMAEQQTALCASWMKELAHSAGHAGVAVEEIKAAESALKAARRSLEDAVTAVEDGPRSPSFEVSSV